MSFLQTEDFRQTYLDATNLSDYPTGRLEIGATVMTVLPGDGDAKMPELPFVALIAANQTFSGLVNSECVLAYSKTDSDSFNIVRDWNNYTILPVTDARTGSINNPPDGYVAGTTVLNIVGMSGIVEWNYLRIGNDPQMYRITNVSGDNYTIEPELLRDVNHGEIVRVVADHFRAGTTDPVSKERAHADHEQIIILQVKINLEELQDQIKLLTDLAYPHDIYADTITLTNHVRVGTKKVGFPDAAGMIVLDGGHFKGYNGTTWKNLDELPGGGGDSFPAGTLGQTLRYGDTGWESTSIFQIFDDKITATFDGRTFNYDGDLSLDGGIDAAKIRSKYFYARYEDTFFEFEASIGAHFSFQNFFSGPTAFIISGNPAGDVYPFFMLGGSGPVASDSDVKQSYISITGDLILQATIPEAATNNGGIVGINAQRASFVAVNDAFVFRAVTDYFYGTNLPTAQFECGVTVYTKPLNIHSDTYSIHHPRADYPTSPQDGMHIYHVDDGHMVYQAGDWLPITGDSMTFAAPGTAWSTVHWNPDDAEWQYTAGLLIEPKGVRVEKSLIVGHRDEDQAEEGGMIEYVNGDLQGFVAGPDGEGLIRVSLTNISPEQRLPAADLAAGAFMYAKQDGLGRWVWKSTGTLNWDEGNSRLVAPTIKVGDGAGTSGLFRWNSGLSRVEWNNGATWFSLTQESTMPTPTTLGAFMYVTGDVNTKEWAQTTIVSIIDNKFVTATIEVETLRLGPDGDGHYVEFNAADFNIPALSSHAITMYVLDTVEPFIDCSAGWGSFKTMTVGTLNVNTLNLTSPDEQPLSFEMERLVLKDRESGAVRFVLDPGVDELQLIHDDVDPYMGWYQEVTTTYTGAVNGAHLVNDTTIAVDGLGALIEAGTRVTINHYTYKIIGVSGTPTTMLTITPGLKEAIADNQVITIKYGNLLTRAYGNLQVDYDLRVKARAIFDYTIKLNNINDSDGEIDGAADEPGMIRYNGDFQGRLASGQWASFTRTIMDGNFTTPWGSSLWWNGSLWSKNNNFQISASGALLLAPDDSTSATPGAMRFTGTDFQGCVNIGVWQTLTALEDLPSLPSGAGYEGATLRWHNDNWVVNPYLSSDGVKTTVTLLEIQPYENFYDAGYIDNIGGYSTGVTTMAVRGFIGPVAISDTFTIPGVDSTVYTITGRFPTDGPPSTITFTPGLSDSAANNLLIRIDGVLPRPEAKGGQFRYNQNDYEGFIEGVGWASFTGHRSWLPNRIGDPNLTKGNLLYFDGTTWIADHTSYMNNLVLTLDKDLDVLGDIDLAGSLRANGIQVGSPLTYYTGRVVGIVNVGASVCNVSGFGPGQITNGDQFRFTNQSTLYTITDVTLTSGIPSSIEFSPTLVTALNTITTDSIVFYNAVESNTNDPVALPGFMYFSAGRRRFRGCLSTTDTEEAPAWVDLVSPIQMVVPPVMGQTLFYNKAADYWHNTSLFIVNGGREGDDTYYEGWLHSELPLQLMKWQLKTEEIPYEGSEEDLYDQMQFAYGENPTDDPDPYMIFHTTSTAATVQKSVFVNQNNFFAKKLFIGSTVTAPYLGDLAQAATYKFGVYGKSYFGDTVHIEAGGFFIKDGTSTIRNGNLFIDNGDLILGRGSLETQDVYASGSGYFGTYVRVGYAETSGFLSAGAIRYSLPNNAGRGDWEGWDGSQWVSFTAGFHGQAIWWPDAMPVTEGLIPFYDDDFHGGKFTVEEGFKYDNSLNQLDVFQTQQRYLNFLGDTPTIGIGRMAFDGDDLMFSINGSDWVSLLRPGSSGLASGTIVGQVLYWDGAQYLPTNSLNVTPDLVTVNKVWQLVDYDTIVSPPAAAGGQIRYNLNDYECFLVGHGWVSLTGHVPFQNPDLYSGQFLYSDGDNWVANTWMRVVGGDLFGDGRDSLVWGYNELKNTVLNGQLHTTAGAHFGGAILIGDTLPSWVGLAAQGFLRTQYTGLDARLEFYAKHDGEVSASWHKVMFGDSHLIAQDLGMIVYDPDDGKYKNTDLMWLERNPDNSAQTVSVAVKHLDIRNDLNFGNSAVDTNFFRFFKVGNILKVSVAASPADVPEPVYAFGPWVTSPDAVPFSSENGTNSTMALYNDAYYYIHYEYGSTNKAVYKRAVGGDSWQLITSDHGMDMRTQQSIAVFGGYMWVMGGKTASAGFPSDKVYKSNDGITWTYVGTLPVALNSHTAVGIPGDAMYIFGGEVAGIGQHKVYRSTDGVTWTDWADGSFPTIRNCISGYHNGRFVLFEDDSDNHLNLWHSADAITWTKIADPFGLGLVAFHSFALTTIGNRLYFYGGWESGDLNTVRYCEDNLNIWSMGATMPVATTMPMSTHVITHELIFFQRYGADPRMTYTYQGVQIDGLVGDYWSYDLAGSMTAWRQMTFKEEVTFEQTVTFGQDTVFNDGITITEGGTWNSGGMTLSVDLTIGAADYNRNLHIYGDLIVTGDIYKAAETINVDRVINSGFVGVGISDLNDMGPGDVRYTGAMPCKIDAIAALGATTVHIKDVSVAVIPSIADETRFVVKGHALRYKILTATDNGGGDWTLTISPGLYAAVAVDQPAQTYVEGDWEGWTGTYWKSLTNDGTSDVFVARNQGFSSQTSVTVTHGLGQYPVVQVIDNTGVVIVPLAITHTSINQFTVTFTIATTGTIAW